MWTLPHYTTQAICIILLAVQQWMMNLKSMVPNLLDHIKRAEVELVPCHDSILGSGKMAQILTVPLNVRWGISFTPGKVYTLQGVPGSHWKVSCVGLSQTEHSGILLPLPRKSPSFLRHPASRPCHILTRPALIENDFIALWEQTLLLTWRNIIQFLPLQLTMVMSLANMHVFAYTENFTAVLHNVCFWAVTTLIYVHECDRRIVKAF